MKHSDFRIGREFMTAAGCWRCTDVGKRTVAAIRLDLDGDPRWYNGPPYAVVEHVFENMASRVASLLRGGNRSITVASSQS